MFGAICGGGDEGKIDICDHHPRKFDFSLLSGFCEALEGLTFFAKIDIFGGEKLFCQPIDNLAIEIHPP